MQGGTPVNAVAFISLWGCLAGFFCPMFGIHRILFALGRAGYVPQVNYSRTFSRDMCLFMFECVKRGSI